MPYNILKRKGVIPLDPEPCHRWLSYAAPVPQDDGEEQQPLYMNPCLSYLPEEEVEFIRKLPKELQATPGKYFLKDKNEVDVVRFFVDKCPDGTTQNIKQARCEPRPGQDLQQLCGTKSPVSGKSQLEMLQNHLIKVKEDLKNQQQGQGQGQGQPLQ